MNSLVRRRRGVAFIALPLILAGCATVLSWFRSAGTYAVAADQRLDVMVWVQWGAPGQNRVSEGTTPLGMYRGVAGAYGISSGSSRGSSERGGRGGGGGG